MKKERLLLVVAMALATIGALSSCSTDDFGPDNTGEGTPDEEGKIVFDISFAPTDNDGQQTRVATSTDGLFKSTWEEGDEIGVFGCLANPDTPDISLEKSGNPLHNVKLTYTSGKWVGDAWWPTLADLPAKREMHFFAYYPYNAAATDPTAIAFAVKTDQSNTTYGKPNYNLSDLLFGESHNYKRGETVELTFHHALSLVQVNVPVGTLTGSGPNGELEVSLMARAKATVNLRLCNSKFEVKPADNDNDPVAIRMQRVEDPIITTGYTYRALVPAQELAAGSRIFRLNHEGRQLFIDAPLKDGVSLAWSKVAKFTRSLPPSALQTVKIEAGRFQMGSPESETGRGNNETQHWVTLTKGFRMCKYEITCAQFAEFLNAVGAEHNEVSISGTSDPFTQAKYKDKILLSVGNNYQETVQWINGKWAAPSGKENFPVNYVSWYGADEYARWVGGSLPSEAQWEYACRAGTTTPWSFGDVSVIGDYAWYSGNSGSNYHDVGSKKCNPWKLYDMHGNVGEWCLDYATGSTPADYGSADATDPVNTNRTTSHILRGGGYGSAAENCRSARRSAQETEVPGQMTGFRVIFPDK